jgi:hypothetical protein
VLIKPAQSMAKRRLTAFTKEFAVQAPLSPLKDYFTALFGVLYLARRNVQAKNVLDSGVNPLIEITAPARMFNTKASP